VVLGHYHVCKIKFLFGKPLEHKVYSPEQRFPTFFVPFPPWCLPKVAVSPLTQSFIFGATLTRHNPQKHIAKDAATEDRSVEETNRHQIDQYQSIIHYIKAEHHCHHETTN